MFERKLRLSWFLFIIIAYFDFAAAQETESKSYQTARDYIDSRGETIIRFIRPGHLSIAEISLNLSIDNLNNDTVIAYANKKGFLWFSRLKIPYEVIPPPSLKKDLLRESAGKQKIIDYYPSYDEYVEMMNSFEERFGDICLLRDFGSSVDGRRLLAVKISDNPGLTEKEPVVFYSATMHGDEPLGYVIMLKLIEYLLDRYHLDQDIRDLVDSTEIWINPLANPDGAYFISDSSVEGSIRFNKNGIDLNRDFPKIPSDVRDSATRQPETNYMMDLMEHIRPALAANFHSGAELVNYPWDSFQTTHADDSWFRKISRAYADTVHENAPEGYMTMIRNGITRGIEWYLVYGSRQDYLTYYMSGREVTIELSLDKLPSQDQIENFWNYNRKSLIQYISNAHTGFQGTVTDSASGLPLRARVRIINHDRLTDNSFVFTRTDNGNYYRLISEGNYQVVFSATGHSYKIANVIVNRGILTNLDVKLSSDFSLKPFPNPFRDRFILDMPYSGYMLDITFIDITGRKVKIIRQPVTVSGEQEIVVQNLLPGYYIINIFYNNQTWQVKALKTGP